MPNFTPGIYNQAIVGLTVNQIPMEGLNDENPIRIVTAQENATVTASGVGSAQGSTSFAKDQSGTIEVDFKSTSVSLDVINQLYRGQKAGLVSTFNIFLVDGSGRAYPCAGCAIKTLGTVTTGGKVEQPQTVIFTSEKLEASI